MYMDLTEKVQAPNFSLKGSDGSEHKLSDYLGRKVVLYFYPKDNTPGCAKEASCFIDSIPIYRKVKVDGHIDF